MSFKGGNMGKIDYVKNYKNIKIKISDGTIIAGKINVMSHEKLSLYLKTTNDRFVTILSEGTEDKERKVTIINREHIIWADTWD
jgi:hypothetical protein